MGRDVATLMITVNGHVETHEFNKLGVVVADHFAEVGAPVEVGVDGGGGGAVAVQVVVDDGGNGGQIGDAIHAVLVRMLPVGRLVDAIIVCLGEFGLGIHEGDGGRELGHGVDVGGQIVEHLLDMGGKAGALG